MRLGSSSAFASPQSPRREGLPPCRRGRCGLPARRGDQVHPGGPTKPAMNVFTGRSNHAALGYGRMLPKAAAALPRHPPRTRRRRDSSAWPRSRSSTQPGIPCRGQTRRRKAESQETEGKSPVLGGPSGSGSIALRRRPARSPSTSSTKPLASRSPTPERGPVSTTMTLHLTGTAAEPELLTLPWRLALESWPERVLVALPRGISRHTVRFVRGSGGVLAIKETSEPIADREYALLFERSGEEHPSNRSQSCRDGPTLMTIRFSGRWSPSTSPIRFPIAQSCRTARPCSYGRA